MFSGEEKQKRWEKCNKSKKQLGNCGDVYSKIG